MATVLSTPDACFATSSSDSSVAIHLRRAFSSVMDSSFASTTALIAVLKFASTLNHSASRFSSDPPMYSTCFRRTSASNMRTPTSSKPEPAICVRTSAAMPSLVSSMSLRRLDITSSSVLDFMFRFKRVSTISVSSFTCVESACSPISGGKRISFS